MVNPGMGLSPQAASMKQPKTKMCQHCGGVFTVSKFKRWHGINCLKAFTNGKQKK